MKKEVTYTVGKVVPPEAGVMPVESCFFRIDKFGLLVTLVNFHMSNKELDCFRLDNFDLALHIEDGVGHMLLHTKVSGVFAMPFHAAVEGMDTHDDLFQLSDDPVERYRMNLIVIDGGSMIVKVSRAFSLSPYFSRGLMELVNAQHEFPITRTQFMHKFAGIQLRNSNKEMFVKAAFRCRSGD